MRKVYQNVWFKNFDPEKGTVEIYNENFFIDLSWYDFFYTVKSEGKKMTEGKLTINVKPQETEKLNSLLFLLSKDKNQI